MLLLLLLLEIWPACFLGGLDSRIRRSPLKSPSFLEIPPSSSFHFNFKTLKSQVSKRQLIQAFIESRTTTDSFGNLLPQTFPRSHSPHLPFFSFTLSLTLWNHQFKSRKFILIKEQSNTSNRTKAEEIGSSFNWCFLFLFF